MVSKRVPFILVFLICVKMVYLRSVSDTKEEGYGLSSLFGENPEEEDVEETEEEPSVETNPSNNNLNTFFPNSFSNQLGDLKNRLKLPEWPKKSDPEETSPTSEHKWNNPFTNLGDFSLPEWSKSTPYDDSPEDDTKQKDEEEDTSKYEKLPLNGGNFLPDMNWAKHLFPETDSDKKPEENSTPDPKDEKQSDGFKFPLASDWWKNSPFYNKDLKPKEPETTPDPESNENSSEDQNNMFPNFNWGDLLPKGQTDQDHKQDPDLDDEPKHEQHDEPKHDNDHEKSTPEESKEKSSSSFSGWPHWPWLGKKNEEENPKDDHSKPEHHDKGADDESKGHDDQDDDLDDKSDDLEDEDDDQGDSDHEEEPDNDKDKSEAVDKSPSEEHSPPHKEPSYSSETQYSVRAIGDDYDKDKNSMSPSGNGDKDEDEEDDDEEDDDEDDDDDDDEDDEDDSGNETDGNDPDEDYGIQDDPDKKKKDDEDDDDPSTKRFLEELEKRRNQKPDAEPSGPSKQKNKSDEDEDDDDDDEAEDEDEDSDSDDDDENDSIEDLLKQAEDEHSDLAFIFSIAKAYLADNFSLGIPNPLDLMNKVTISFGSLNDLNRDPDYFKKQLIKKVNEKYGEKNEDKLPGTTITLWPPWISRN